VVICNENLINYYQALVLLRLVPETALGLLFCPYLCLASATPAVTAYPSPACPYLYPAALAAPVLKHLPGEDSAGMVSHPELVAYPGLDRPSYLYLGSPGRLDRPSFLCRGNLDRLCPSYLYLGSPGRLGPSCLYLGSPGRLGPSFLCRENLDRLDPSCLYLGSPGRLGPSCLCRESLGRLDPSCLYLGSPGRLGPSCLYPGNLAPFHPCLYLKNPHTMGTCFFDSTGINLHIDNVGSIRPYLYPSNVGSVCQSSVA